MLVEAKSIRKYRNIVLSSNLSASLAHIYFMCLHIQSLHSKWIGSKVYIQNGWGAKYLFKMDMAMAELALRTRHWLSIRRSFGLPLFLFPSNLEHSAWCGVLSFFLRVQTIGDFIELLCLAVLFYT